MMLQQNNRMEHFMKTKDNSGNSVRDESDGNNIKVISQKH